MKMTLKQAFGTIDREETFEAYQERCRKLRHLAEERADLQRLIRLSEAEGGDTKRDKRWLNAQKKKLRKVLKQIEKLR